MSGSCRPDSLDHIPAPSGQTASHENQSSRWAVRQENRQGRGSAPGLRSARMRFRQRGQVGMGPEVGKGPKKGDNFYENHKTIRYISFTNHAAGQACKTQQARQLPYKGPLLRGVQTILRLPCRSLSASENREHQRQASGGLCALHAGAREISQHHQNRSLCHPLFPRQDVRPEIPSADERGAGDRAGAAPLCGG